MAHYLKPTVRPFSIIHYTNLIRAPVQPFHQLSFNTPKCNTEFTQVYYMDYQESGVGLIIFHDKNDPQLNHSMYYSCRLECLYKLTHRGYNIHVLSRKLHKWKATPHFVQIRLYLFGVTNSSSDTFNRPHFLGARQGRTQGSTGLFFKQKTILPQQLVILYCQKQ